MDGDKRNGSQLGEQLEALERRPTDRLKKRFTAILLYSTGMEYHFPPARMSPQCVNIFVHTYIYEHSVYIVYEHIHIYIYIHHTFHVSVGIACRAICT